LLDDLLLKQKHNLEKDLNDLREALEKEKKEHQKDLADKDSEKLHATENLKQDMENKI